jgi:23S rRNA pseudouridine1911/1915/1917 synthase
MSRASKLEVLYEDNHLLVVVKPAGLPTQGAAADRPSLLTVAKQYIRRKYHKPGNVYLGVVSRLDALVSGVVVLARTSKSANRLNRQFRLHTVHKGYWALVEGIPEPAEATCVDWVWHDERHRRMRVTDQAARGALEARLNYRRLDVFHGFALVDVELVTGRKHQIRVQLAHRGWPIVGDRQYGSRVEFPSGIALHARQLEFNHPIGGGALEFNVAAPDCWAAFRQQVSGLGH